MSRFLTTLAVLVSFTSVPLLTGCDHDHTVRSDTATIRRPDGSVTQENTKVIRKSDGSVVTEQNRVNNP